MFSIPEVILKGSFSVHLPELIFARFFSCTPLMFASMSNHPHVVNELLGSGASLTLTNINGHSALALAVKSVSTAAAFHLVGLFKSP